MFSNTLLMSLRAIRRNAMRSALTILGIVIGVGAVVALVTIGRGATEQVTSEIGALGNRLLTVRPGAGHRPGAPRTAASAFSLNDSEAIQREISGIDFAAPSSSSQSLIVFKNTNHSTQVTGTTNDYLSCLGYKLANGRNFSVSDESGGRAVCILGATVVGELFKEEDPIGQRIRVGKTACAVIGVLSAKGQGAMGMDQDDILLMPIRAFQRRISGNSDVSNISITVGEGYSTSSVKSSIELLMRERRGIAPGATDDFNVRDLMEIASAMRQTTSIMTTLLSAIAAVSLLVGGIGIMNIMLVSVTERTREIGIRMAIGATGSEVLLQFLVEAAVLSGLGGIVGLILGNAGAIIATKALDMPFSPSVFVAVVAFVFSVFVGIMFGYLPARKASKLNPIEA